MMDRNVVRHLVYSIAQFLHGQIENAGNIDSALTEEGVESVEVALQCLETAYSLSQDSAGLAVSTSLYDAFCQANAIEIHSHGSARWMTENGSKVSTAEDKEEAEMMKNKGNQMMHEEKFNEALEMYTKAIAKDSTNAVYYCNRAAAYSKLSRQNEAIDDCRRALEIEPNYSKAYGRMGLAYSNLSNHMKAKECYEKSLELEPDNESYQANLSIAEEKLKQDVQQQQTSSVNPFAALGGAPQGPFAGLAGVGGGSGQSPDLGGLLNNPALMNIATTLMSDPNMQNLMTNILSSTASGDSSSSNSAGVTSSGSGEQTAASSHQGMEALLNIGRQLAEQMHSQHPELVEQIRSQMGRDRGSDGSNGSQGPSQS